MRVIKNQVWYVNRCCFPPSGVEVKLVRAFEQNVAGVGCKKKKTQIKS